MGGVYEKTLVGGQKSRTSESITEEKLFQETRKQGGHLNSQKSQMPQQEKGKPTGREE